MPWDSSSVTHCCSTFHAAHSAKLPLRSFIPDSDIITWQPFNNYIKNIANGERVGGTEKARARTRYIHEYWCRIVNIQWGDTCNWKHAAKCAPNDAERRRAIIEPTRRQHRIDIPHYNSFTRIDMQCLSTQECVPGNLCKRIQTFGWYDNKRWSDFKSFIS